MGQAYVIEAVRTAVGKRNGSLAGVHPVDLGAAGWRGLLGRVDVDPGAGLRDDAEAPIVRERNDAGCRVRRRNLELPVFARGADGRQG
mgnify:CR=1 FL=1